MASFIKVVSKMKNVAVKLLMVSSLMALTACSINDDSFFPSLLRSDSQTDNAVTSNTAYFNADTGTFVGQKIEAFRKELAHIQQSNDSNTKELQKLRNSVLDNTTQYNKFVADIETKLQVGTTPGNPNMYNLLQNAQNNVQAISANYVSLDSLSSRVAANSTSVNYLVDSLASAFNISGAVEKDHSNLRNLQNQAEQLSVLINNLNAEINQDIASQQQYLSSAMAQVNNLNSAIQVGSFKSAPARAVRPLFSTPSKPLAHHKLKSPAKMSGKALFVARFEDDNVNYKDGLKIAINAALEKKPNAVFEVVAVSNTSNSAKSKDHAGRIMKEIVALGVNANQVNLSSKNNTSVVVAEVQVFVK